MSSRVTIVTPPPEQIADACRVLFSHRPEPVRALQADRACVAFAAGEFDANELIVARMDGRIVGAGYVHIAAGGVASVWPPRADPGPDSAAIEDALSATYLTRFRDAGVTVAQALLSVDDRPAAGPLERAGFRLTTRLEQYCRPLVNVDPNVPPDLPVRLEAVGESDPRLPELLLASYEGTLDCPELNGRRSAADVLANYRDAADGRPDWWIVREGASAVGVALLTPGTGTGVAELAYLGLIPSARGRGLGTAAVRHVIARKAAAGAEWLTLSVDARNEPAARLYRRLKFRLIDAQDVFLWLADCLADPFAKSPRLNDGS